MKSYNMNNKETNKESLSLVELTSNLSKSQNCYYYGILYTTFSNKFNSLEVGFAENYTVLDDKLSNKEIILLDKKKGKKKQLTLLVKTLNELGIKYSDNLSFQYSNKLIRHLYTLGWPVGRSLYKQRKIKKELVYE